MRRPRFARAFGFVGGRRFAVVHLVFGGQGQPSQDFGLRDLPVDGFLKFRWQFVQRPRLVQRLVQPIDDLAPRQGSVERLGPGLTVEIPTGEGPVGAADGVSGAVLVLLDRFHALGQQLGCVYEWRPLWQPSLLAPELPLVVLRDRLDGILRHAEEPRGEDPGRFRPLRVDDRRRRGDADRVHDLSAAEGPQAADEARGLGAQAPVNV